MRRKELGYATRCFYCPESELFCLENDHPVTEKLDPFFKRAVCRNCHRKEEARRDLQGLTKNGLHDATETPRQAHQRYLRLVADDEDRQADLLENAPLTTPKLIIDASRSRAKSLRRKADSFPEWMFPTPVPAAVEWDGAGCA
jgi:hypothetical protein